MKTINYNGNSEKTGIYLIKNIINNKVYVGSTKSKFHSRKTRHLVSLRSKNHYNEYLQSSWDKYGEDAFIFEVYIICDSEYCEKLEEQTIIDFKSRNRIYGYNIATVKGYCSGYKITDIHLKEKSILKKEKAKNKNGIFEIEKGINKPINLFDINGNFIKHYNSQKDLSIDKSWTEGAISTCLSKRKLVLNKHIIIYENDNLTKADVINCLKKAAVKKVYLYDLQNNYLQSFDSAKLAAEFLKCKDAEVRMCCTNKRTRIKNYKTKYESKTIQ